MLEYYILKNILCKLYKFLKVQDSLFDYSDSELICNNI